ncbi:hypothetical protein BH23ACI1_BH23ACI1_29240 [soil metagenome]
MLLAFTAVLAVLAFFYVRRRRARKQSTAPSVV